MMRKLVRSLPIAILGCAIPRYAFGAPTRAQAMEIAWEDLLALIPDWWIRGGKDGPNVSISKLAVRTIFGSIVRVVGLDKAHRIEGKYLNGFCGDEWSDVKPGVFDKVIRPMLADYGGWAVLGGVPKRQGIGAGWYRKFCEDIQNGSYPGGAVFSWPASDILPIGEVKHAQQTLDPKDYAEQYDARWQTAGGGIFHAFERDYNVRACPYRPNMPIIVGSDFNVDPMAWMLGHSVDGRMEWFEEIWIRDCNTQRALDTLFYRHGDHKGGFLFYGDASSKARKTSASNSDRQIIHNDQRFMRVGRTLHYTDSNPAVVDRFAACNAMFCNAAGERRMFVDPQCTHLISDLETRYYKPGTRDPADVGDAGHITDAMGYPVYRLFPIRVKLNQRMVVGTT